MTVFDFAKIFDHTLLKPDATLLQIITLCKEAKEYEFGAICVPSYWIREVKTNLFGSYSSIKIVSVIGFPLGNCLTSVKEFETKKAIEHGANEIDMVMNIGALKSKQYQIVYQDINSVVQCAKKINSGILVKVILETGLLGISEKIIACRLITDAKADFVKTSTGFLKNGKGATIDDVELLCKNVGPKIKVKASGGIKNLSIMKDMIKAGATRIGTSSSVKIYKEYLNE